MGSIVARLALGCAVALLCHTRAVAAAASDATTTDAALQHALHLLSRHPLIDGHNDLPSVIRESGIPPRDVEAYDLGRRAPHDTDIERLRQGHVGAQFWSVWVPSTEDVTSRGAARIQLEQIDIARRMIERYPGDLCFALTAADIEQARRAGCIASLLGIEGGHVIENSLGVLRAYHRLGVRYMTLTHFKGNDWADSATDEAKHGGLSRFGQEVVREMNRIGMLVDLSHVSTDAMNDVLDIAQAPVIFSHSSARALTDHPRNVPDPVLQRLPANGGVVMASFISVFNARGSAYDAWLAGFAEASGNAKLGDANYEAEMTKYRASHPEPRATIPDVADHIEHIRTVAGIDHVGVGSDFFGEEASMAVGLEDTSRYPLLFAELVRRGWSDVDLAKLSRGNLLRVLKAAEQASARTQRARPASNQTIEQLDRGQDKPDLY